MSATSRLLRSRKPVSSVSVTNTPAQLPKEAAVGIVQGKFGSTGEALQYYSLDASYHANVGYYLRTWKRNGHDTILRESSGDVTTTTNAPVAESSSSVVDSSSTVEEQKISYTYKDAYLWAGREYAKGNPKKSLRTISKEATEKFGVSIDYTTMRNASFNPGVLPCRPGPRQLYPESAEKTLIRFIKEMRALKLPTFKCIIKAYADKLIKGTEYEQNYPNGVTDAWYLRFLLSHKDTLSVGNQTSLEVDREHWVTAENIKKHYEVVRDELLKHGFAVHNPSYNPSKPYNHKYPDDLETQELLWVEPKKSRVFSYDETLPTFLPVTMTTPGPPMGTHSPPTTQPPQLEQQPPLCFPLAGISMP